MSTLNIDEFENQMANIYSGSVKEDPPLKLPEVKMSDEESKKIAEEGDSQRLLLVTRTDGTTFKILCAKGDKVTFGPSIPGAKDSNYSRVNEYSLRIYRGTKETGLKAAFPGVREFRESDIIVAPW